MKKEKFSLSKNIIIPAMCIELCIILLIGIFIYGIEHGQETEYFVLFSTLLVLSFMALFMLYLAINIQKRKRILTQEELEKYKNKIDDAINSNTDVLEKMKIKLMDIKEYYDWSRVQAKTSFIFSMTMCVFGVIVVAISILMPILWKTQLIISIVTAIGGIIIELMSGFVLTLYKNSMLQLNYYHQSLHEDERFLSCVSLVNKLKDDNLKEEMIKEIIKNELELNTEYINYLLR